MKKLLWSIAFITGLAPLHAQVMRAVTSSAGPGLHVVATWPPSPTIQRFNIYRKIAAAAAFPPTPLNALPIGLITSCTALKVVIPPVSEEWKMIADAIEGDPCSLSTVAPGSVKEQRLQFLARTRWRIAVAIGLAFDDTAVANGTTYVYELRGVNGAGGETGVLLTSAAVTAGSPPSLAAPSTITATGGDNRVLVLWGDQPEAAGFAVMRSTGAAGPYTRVNEGIFTSRIKEDIDGKALPSASNGLLDVRRWDKTGHPTTHEVIGVNVAGPIDGVPYFYKVASIDLLGNPGPLSTATANATPLDVTPPAAPTGVSVKAIDTQNRLEVRWNIVEFDLEGHAESSPVSGYRVFRYNGGNDPLASGVQVGGTIPQPPPGVTFVTASDNDPVLRPPFGEKTFWYRIEALDGRGNVSARSVASAGHLGDIVAPHPPKGITAEGFDDFIRVGWSPNNEPDLDAYQIFRGMCHNGASNPCNPRMPGFANPPFQDATGANPENSKVPCTGEYVLVGTVSLAQAKAMGTTIHFDDRTIPAGSPLCYSYWVKAVDRSGNQSGTWPFPSPDEQTVCQRLRDKTPPDPAIITGLSARNHAIRVEWVGPPVQDIRAYHVYRAPAEAGPYKWVGGMTVELPPAVPAVLLKPYTAPPTVGCAKIPLVTIDAMSMGFFVDQPVDAKTIYWYKVVGIDQSGNEAPLDKAVPVSTFTFTTEQGPSPGITSITGTTASPLGLVIRWSPAFSATSHRGFAVFKSDRFDGLYRQIGSLVTASEYQDNQVVRGATYWYKVVAMDITGQVSIPSAPQGGTLP